MICQDFNENFKFNWKYIWELWCIKLWGHKNLYNNEMGIEDYQ